MHIRPYCVVIHVSDVLVTPSDTQALSNSSILIKIYSVLKLSYIILTIVKDIINIDEFKRERKKKKYLYMIFESKTMVFAILHSLF